MNTPIQISRTDGVNGYFTVRVAEQTPMGLRDHEYNAIVPLTQLQGLTPAQKLAVIGKALKDERDRSLALSQPQSQTDLGITGTVTL